ncbi:MAG: hypothetical protein GXY79_01510 [Chloroflexi bacterium]|nr:hypothetical protein [Chloroflexota bacterium]
MADSGTLTTAQRRFIASLMGARSVRDAAKKAKISERTAYRYLRDPAVKTALRELLDEAEGQAVRLAVDAMTEAIKTLSTIHKNPKAPTGARVSAARAILECAPRLREALDLAERVTELEQNLGEG